MLKNTTLFLVAVIVTTLIFVQPASAENYQGYTINSIEAAGNSNVSSSLIISVSGLRRGTKLSSVAIQEAIKKVYGLNLFSDVTVDGEFSGGGVNLRVRVVEHPKLKSLKFEGNKKLKEDDFKEEMTIFENQTVGPHQIQSNIEVIKNLYRQEGYFLVEVESDSKFLSDSEIELIYKINEKEKVKIRAIEFSGNHIYDDGELSGKIKSKPKSFFRSGTFKDDQFEEDKEKIITFYNNKGYLDASIVSDSISIDPDGKRMVVYIEVFEGDRYYFGDIKITGNELYKVDFLLKQLKFKTGDIYNSEKYQESIGNLYTAYYEDGYIHVRVQDNTQTTDSTLNVNLEIGEGQPAHINKIYITGNYKTKEKVIRRELYSRPGQVFHRSLLMRSIRNAMVLNYFSNVEPEMKQLPNGDIDLEFKVTEKSTGQVQAGAAYSEQDKIVGTLGLGIPNFRGNGQNVSLNWSFGSRRNSISVSFTEPWLLDTPTSIGVDLYNINRQYESLGEEFTEGSRGFSLRLGRRLNWPDNYFKVWWRYRLEDSRIYDFNDTYRTNHVDDVYSLLQFEDEWRRTSATSVTIARDSRDLAQFATAGSNISLTSEYSGGILGGNWHYHKHILDIAKYHRVWWKFSLAAKVRVGVVDSPDGDSKIPITERFAPGGTYRDGIIRGYEDGSVGPRNSAGALVRGRSVLIYNLELQFPVVEQQIYGLFFADAGNSWLTGQAIKPFDLGRDDGLKKSYGAGFRVVVPGIGTIGFDFAYGLNRPGGAEWKPHFQIGTTF